MKQANREARAMVWRIFQVAAFLLGVAALPQPVTAQEQGTIFFGPDAEVLTLQRERWQACRRRCDNDDRCVGWTYIEGVNQCRLKEAIWLKADNQCCVSGYKQDSGGQPGGQPGGGGDDRPNASAGIDNAAILRLHYNSRADGRGICIQTQPAVPRAYRGWACLWKDNPLYAEIDRLLNDANARNLACNIEWNDRPRGSYAELQVVSCVRR
ncbi:hypothetical protein ACKTEK_01870 [Tepidamorphus sp. 3E244]|uniref:hypothetical protein n=1 Tax=Tepidamorphus sp. 3E244 TaxID=3385498 RepID=UPI0038FC094E